MADIWTKRKRSQVMALIRSRANLETELRLVTLFRANHIIGWRRNQSIFGKPDFLFRCERLAVFVDGCFWHGCPKCYRRPKSRQKFWDAKVTRNRQRDIKVTRMLRKNGWQVTRLWAHELTKNPHRAVAKIRIALHR